MTKLTDYSKDDLIKMVCSLKECKKFGLVWEDKPEDVAVQCERQLPILKEVSKKAITTAQNSTTNLIIEGDNYHALSVLNYTHTGKIDVIYIDPPYNTGNAKEWKYNDKFVDSTDSYKHSKWLSFMEKRLCLAKSLLKDTGAIFISIDDNEQAHLKVLCDEIFGSENCLGNICWLKKNAQNDAHNIQKNHEYILVYGRENSKIFTQSIHTKKVFEESGKYFYIGAGLTTGGAGGTLNARPNLGWSVYYNPDTKDFIGVDDYDHKLAKTNNNENDIYTNDEKLLKQGYKIIRPPKKGVGLGRWTWALEKFNTNKDKIIIIETRNGFSIYKKEFVNKNEVNNQNGQLSWVLEKDTPFNSFIDDVSSSNGIKELSEIFSEKVFNNPKSINLIQKFIKQPDAIVLDFFAGSGTTGHAVLELNKEDGGNRQFILCTNNENNIAEEVCYPRIKTVITGTRKDGSKYSDGIPANVSYFKTDFVSKSQTSDKLRREIAPLCTDMIKIRENAFDSIIDTEILKVFRNANGLVALVFDRFDLATHISEIEKVKTDSPVRLYVFSYDANARDLEIPKKTKHKYINCPIPEGVLSVYRRIFNKKDSHNV